MKGEINLLPKGISLRREKKLFLQGVGRLLHRISLMLVVLLIGEAVVYAAFFFIDNELEKSSEKQNGISNITNEIKRVNEVLAQTEKAKSEYVNWSLFIEEILRNAPQGIKINKMQVKEGEGTLEVRGFSDSRSTVLGFQNLLKKFSWVIRVEAPLQNFALGSDTSFSFNLIVIEQKK